MVVRATTSTTATAPFNVLDVYTGAVVAFSLRRLSGAYSGAAVRVRRSSDNVEQDIGFDASGNLNESALTSFIGANSGFVTTWYDQSGASRDMTQSIAANQLRIVNNGSLERAQGRLAIYSEVGKSMSTVTTSWLVVGNGDRAMISVSTRRAPGGMSTWSGIHSGNQAWGIDFGTIATFAPYTYGVGDTLLAAIAQDKTCVITANRLSGSSIGSINNIDGLPNTSVLVTTSNNGLGIGKRPDNSESIGHYSEIIYFNVGLSSSIKSAIEKNAMSYYGIS